MKKVLLISICVLALIIALIVGVTIYQRSVSKEYVRLNEDMAITIHNDIYKNTISAREKWKNTDVVIIGTVDSINSNRFHMDFIYGSRVGSIFVETSKKEILKLNRGDKVKVCGEMKVGMYDGALSIHIDADEIIKQ
ncbi:MAG: hypothetical protein IKB32_01145 [Clostridia bacterium]|nr:hypothetical protein [Clostridia bacterium]